MRQLSLTKYALRSLVQAHLHCRHSAGLLQCYTSRNSRYCCNQFRKPPLVQHQEQFSGTLSLFYAALASGVAQNRFQEHNPVSTSMNSAYDRLKFFEVVLGCRHQLCHWTGSKDSNEHHSWCFCDSGAVYRCDHLVSSVAWLDIKSC